MKISGELILELVRNANGTGLDLKESIRLAIIHLQKIPDGPAGTNTITSTLLGFAHAVGEADAWKKVEDAAVVGGAPSSGADANNMLPDGSFLFATLKPATALTNATTGGSSSSSSSQTQAANNNTNTTSTTTTTIFQNTTTTTTTNPNTDHSHATTLIVKKLVVEAEVRIPQSESSNVAITTWLQDGAFRKAYMYIAALE